MSDLLNSNSTSLSKIFNKKPEDITDSELEIIVDALRKDRERFSLATESKKKTQAKPDLKIEDLGL